MNFKSYFKFLI